MKQTFLSPAKVNLILKVLSKRPDGYHNIISVVDPVSLYDLIHIEEIDNDCIIVKDNKGILPEDEQNTMYRAAKHIKETYSVPQRGPYLCGKDNPHRKRPWRSEQQRGNSLESAFQDVASFDYR